MSEQDFDVAAAAVNGRPQRLVTVRRNDGIEFRDQINTDSAVSRRRFVTRAADRFATDPSDFDWLERKVIDAADDADAQADSALASLPNEERRSQATQIVELGSVAELFHDADGDGYARFEFGGHYEVAAIRSKHYRRWMARLFYLASGKAPSSQALQDGIGVLEGKALFEGELRTVSIRIAELDGKIYVDLCNPTWQVVEVSGDGWRVLDESPVRFRRAKAMLPLPVPMPGGEIDEAREFVNINDDDWVLFVAGVVGVFGPMGPYPVLSIQGEHGSGKSTACRLARALIDPNTAMLRSEPREPRDLMIASRNGWVIAFDNVSGIQPWLSDCLCRLSTGGGFSTRTLYENDEETIFDAQRPIMVNGIDEVATRADLLDRCLLVNLPRIDAKRRRPETELWSAFDAARPRILGALLTAVSAALRNRATTQLASLPRMADFALWIAAAEPALGLAPGRFMEVYAANRDAGNEMALESAPIGKPVLELIDRVGQWMGSATELLDELNSKVAESVRRMKTWPATARSLSSAIKRIAPNLRQSGIQVEFGHEGRGRQRRRVIKLTRTDPELIVPTVPKVPTSQKPGANRDVGDASVPAGGDQGTQNDVDVSRWHITEGTIGDDGDANWGDDPGRVTRYSPLRGLCTGRLPSEVLCNPHGQGYAAAHGTTESEAEV